jgi:hypothetical protein
VGSIANRMVATLQEDQSSAGVCHGRRKRRHREREDLPASKEIVTNIAADGPELAETARRKVGDAVIPSRCGVPLLD